ncbi:MAG: glycosyltransferase, partial [Planctomycetota bacterium]|nr:glycosyltransferase [Planctomycetota bacterium]
QGAHSVNRIVADAIRNGMQIPNGWEIVHQTGESQAADIQDLYRQHSIAARVAAFLPDMQAEMSSASIAISRAGAATIQELACAGLPTILIPISTAADDHQIFNARLLEHAQAAVLINETDVDAANLLRSACDLLFADPEQRQKMGQTIRQFATPHASVDIAGLLSAVAKAR